MYDDVMQPVNETVEKCVKVSSDRWHNKNKVLIFQNEIRDSK